MIPTTILSGYLGAGKTTLLNEILKADHGFRIVVLVNDFGEVNIDSALIDTAEEDKMSLTNGCACCAINNDLTAAMQDISERRPAPDAVIIEGSGVANLARLASAPSNFPGFSLAQCTTLVDTIAIRQLLNNKYVKTTVVSQIEDADKIMLTKGDTHDNESSDHTLKLIHNAIGRPVVEVSRSGFLNNLAVELGIEIGLEIGKENRWPQTQKIESHTDLRTGFVSLALVSPTKLTALLRTQTPGLQRLKGFVNTPDGRLLVQMTPSGFELSKTAVSSALGVLDTGLQYSGLQYSGLQYIGTADLDVAGLEQKLTTLVTENPEQFEHAAPHHAP